MDEIVKLPKIANSLNDKAAILQARDKYVRSQRKKQTDIETAIVASGNCEDMCPEYERYCRLDRNLVSQLELTDGEPDEYKMVKEYVRSGADQEEPLPYELRPPEILERTMAYLATNIIDLIDTDEENDDELQTNIGEWYDFLWNRTRAIRKDITQQDLNSLSTVLLMERCARFHIYSAHRFIEEEMNIFDARINNENLVKSIQSLKDFYYDLSLKRIDCPNEAEFRCYDILLNLFNSDILREIKHFKPSIRDSIPIQFAIKVHLAFNNNNFVQFFKLIKETTFLNACVMHRYFGIMRFQAFRLLRRAFTLLKDANQQELFSKEYLFDQLCFEDDQEFDEFCKKIDIEIDEDDNIVIEKNSLMQSKMPSSLVNRRSIEFIDVKKGDQLLSELIYKEPLNENPYKKYPLKVSFDENGLLIDDEIQLDNKIVKIDQKTIHSFAASKALESSKFVNTFKEKENKLEPVQSATIKQQSTNFGLSKGLFSQANVFKNIQQQPNSEQQTSLFGKKPVISSSNIFGIPSLQQQQQSSNIFGVNKESSSTNNQNLFGSNISSQPQSTNLFGTTSNLFSATAANNQTTTTRPFAFKMPGATQQQQSDQFESRKEEESKLKLNKEELSSLIASILQNLLEEVLREVVKRSILNVFIKNDSIEITNQIMTEVMNTLINDLCNSAFNDELRKEAELKQLTNLVSNEACCKLINEQIIELVKLIAKDSYLKELNAFIHNKSQLFANSYFEETFEQLIYEICFRTLRTELIERQRIVNFISEKRGWRLAKFYFRHWKLRCDYLKRYRFLRDNFPASKMEHSPPTLKRVLSVPELMYESTTNKRQLIDQKEQLFKNVKLPTTTRSSLNLDFLKESKMQEELKEIQDRFRRKDRHDELSTKSKVEYARKSLNNLKKVSKTFNELLLFFHK